MTSVRFGLKMTHTGKPATVPGTHIRWHSCACGLYARDFDEYDRANSPLESDHDPFHVPGAGAASCRRSNLGPAIGSSGARFVNPGSPLRQAHSSAKTGTVSILPARVTSISYPVEAAAPLRAAIARRNSGTVRNSSTQDTYTRSRQRSSGKSSDRCKVLSMSWMLVRGQGITSPE
jgi:hypothetical protein